jgi:hypothetical protein
VNYLRCTACRQRFFAGSTRPDPFAQCRVCGASLGSAASTEPAVVTPADEAPAIPLSLPAPPCADPGSYPRGRDCFRSIAEFARSDRSRIQSRERDFGLLWRDGDTLYRAAWIKDTRELYVVQLGLSSAGGGHVELLAVAEPEQLEQTLSGWGDVVDKPDSLHWLRDRVRRHLRPATDTDPDCSQTASSARRRPSAAPHPSPGTPPGSQHESPRQPPKEWSRRRQPPKE